jgi:hypothetical protein
MALADHQQKFTQHELVLLTMVLRAEQVEEITCLNLA